MHLLQANTYNKITKQSLSLINNQSQKQMTEIKQKSIEQKTKRIQVQSKVSGKSSSLISSSRSSSSESSGSQSKYQKKQLQSSKNKINDNVNNEKTRKRQNKYSSGSRSLSSSNQKRSRSIKKQKSSHRHRNRSRQTSHSYRSRDDKRDKYRNQRYRDDRNSSSKYRDDRDRQSKRDHRERQRDRKYDDRRDRRDRGRSRDKNKYSKNQTQKIQKTQRKPITTTATNNDNKLLPHEIPMPIQIPMPSIPGQRRKRERSRSPLGYYRRNQNNNEGDFWDSFSWVPRINYTPNVSSSALVNTKKMRRLMITNVPYEMGITKEDLRQLITRFMTQNYLKDSMNNCPVRDLEINEEDHSASVQLSSVEQTCRMCKLQKVQLFKGYMNGIIRLGDSCYGNNIVTQAQNAAQAQAAAFAAINVLQNKKTTFNMDANLNKGSQPSTLLRVTNAVTPYMAENMSPEQMQDYHEDLMQGLSQFGKIVHNWFVKPSEKDICANPGDLFVEYESQEDAVKAMNEMQGKFYDERVVKIFYVPREIYYPNFKKDLTPPTIKAPPKQKKQTPLSSFQQLSKSSHIATKSQ